MKNNILKKLWHFFYSDKLSNLKRIETTEAYLNLFKGDQEIDTSILQKAHEKAWDSRKFEIDNYWKRTTYFWAFQAASFTGYFAILNSSAYNESPRKSPEILYCIISIGFITAIAWVLINIGSKFWQRHWEKHIDMLEDKITGPLYKTVYAYKTTKTFSVSKINDIISRFFTFIWFLLGLKYFMDNLSFKGSYKEIAWIELLVTIGILYFTGAMFWGHGRGNFGTTSFEFYNREVFTGESKTKG